ncbi:type IV toxin-antitoxin system AbiEi family antitoxin [Egicoccus halophilus]|uniref:AbiEi antitoxin C-terminal domain-containing protein n=1 Tax=Egicoccus halophilus TaxID=1670830 RepID=A0A8J3EW47_9ACTN|nr:hypothetical protein [Egicoccus halophilus]GGI09547.1 hypothetical protein GCM10011354_34620 [Egicoccus halophilus]
MGWYELHRIARHGVVCLADAPMAGIPRQTLQSKAQRERWRMVAPGVWLLPGAPASGVARAYGATRGVAGSVATGWTAANLHGLLRAAPARVELLRPVGVGDITTQQLVARRTRSLPAVDRTTIDGVAVVTAARMLRELARRADAARLRNLVIDARVRDRAILAEVAALLERDQRFPGRRRLSALVSELQDDGSDSGFEFHAVGRLREEGLAPDRQQEAVKTHLGPRFFDLVWLAQGVAVECLGFSFHASAAQLKRDVERQNAIAAAGDQWLVLGLTWEMFHREWPEFVAVLRTCLELRATRRAGGR